MREASSFLNHPEVKGMDGAMVEATARVRRVRDAVADGCNGDASFQSYVGPRADEHTFWP
jgi:hypothetical protein